MHETRGGSSQFWKDRKAAEAFFLLCASGLGGLGSASGVSESCSNGSSVSSGVMARGDVKQCRMDSARKHWYPVQITFLLLLIISY